jgi:hypothetical protein
MIKNNNESTLRRFLNWFWFNTKFFLAFFFLAWLLIIIFPNAMLEIFRQWALLMAMLGAKNIGEFSLQIDMFTHILTRNGIALLIYFIIGLLLQSPIVLVFMGTFYSFIAFLAPETMGKPFGLNDWLLILIEICTLVLSTSISSAIAGDLYEINPDIKSILGYWKKSWTRLWVKPTNNWKSVMWEWSGFTLITIVIISGMSLFVAWFETYGY